MNEQHIVDRYENAGPIVCLRDTRFTDGSFDLEHVLENIMDASYEYVQNKIYFRLSQTSQSDVHQFVNRLRDVGVEEISLDVCERVPFIIHAFHGEMTNHALVHDEENSVYFHEIEITFNDMNQCDKAPDEVVSAPAPKLTLAASNLNLAQRGGLPIGDRSAYLSLVKG